MAVKSRGMNIYITLDYELFFSPDHGSVDKCLIQPANELAALADRYNIKLVFFVDAGFLVKLNEYRTQFPELENDWNKVKEQLQGLSSSGHQIQLHIHPHWEDSFYDGKQWQMNIERYKLADFSTNEIEDIVFRYKKILEDIINKKVFAYRAGGWCIQPFEKIGPALRNNDIWLDSTIYRNGFHLSAAHHYDFRNAPNKFVWKFENDPLVENDSGFFTEIPISYQRISPFFYWKLYLLMRLMPKKYKPVGDGMYIKDKKRIYTSFFYSSNHTVSIDGYFASLLDRALIKHVEKNAGHFVIIGHPKSLAPYSLLKLETFIKKNIKKHQFSTFNTSQPSNLPVQ